MKCKISSYDHLGRGITKIDNKITFVEGALDNEIIEIKVTKSKKNYNEANICKVIEHSPNRVTPICPYYDQCGGCNIMHMSYEEQLKFKEEKIKNIIEKYLDKKDIVKNIVASNKPLEYRNKLTLQIKNEQIGLFSRNSNNIIPIEKCYLVNNEINQAIKNLKIDKNMKQIIIRNGDKIAISHINKENKFVNEEKTNITLDNITFNVSNKSFFQVNNVIATKMFQYVLNSCQPLENKNVLDLFCGCGTISLFLSKKAKKVIGIEINKEAIESAKKNASLNHIENVEFICSDVDQIKFPNKPDIIVVDPPRKGLTNKTIDKILELSTDKIIYISCDPMTMVRDLKLLESKYNILSITPFDMFPNTYHVECVSLLSLKNKEILLRD